VKFLLDMPCVRVKHLQVRVVLYPDIATVKLMFELHCYIIALPWVFSWYGLAKVLWRKNFFVCILK